MTASAIHGDVSFALHGAFRSGTNYLRYLLEENFHCTLDFDAYGWKHGPIAVQNSQARAIYPVPIFAVVKNPAAFCVSLFRYNRAVGMNMEAPKTWRDFLRQKIVIFNGSLQVSPQYRFPNPVSYWNFITWNFATLPAEMVALIRYEDLLEGSETALMPYATQFGLKRRDGGWVDATEQMTRRGSDTPAEKPATQPGRTFQLFRLPEQTISRKVQAERSGVSEKAGG